MQDHIVATDRVPGFAKCPLCRGDIEGDALTFVKKKNGHYIAFSQARLVDRIVDLLSSETSKEQKTLKINTDIDVSKSVRTKWISRSQIEIDHQLHPHRRQRLEYAYFCLVFVGGFLNGVLFENDGLRLIWILALFIPVLLKLLKTATAVFIFLLVLIPQVSKLYVAGL